MGYISCKIEGVKYYVRFNQGLLVFDNDYTKKGMFNLKRVNKLMQRVRECDLEVSELLATFNQ